MYSAWTKHIKDPEEKKKFEHSVLASKHILDHIKTILDDMEKGLTQDEFKKEHYEKPSWAFRQAHDNGYRHCLKMVKTLIDLDKQVINNE